MDLRTFLEAVLPAGNIVLAKRIQKPKPEGGSYWTFAHRCVKLFSDAVTTVDEFVAEGLDAYYAMASYKQGFHKNEKGKSVIRVRENVALLKALWFDIDFKGAYPDVVTAVGALQAFCKAVGLPAPSLLVHSGNGIHVYWPLSEAVSLDRWQRLADALKQAAKEHELGADLACTADACRVLRPPGSTNFKDPANPKPVKLLYSSDKTFDYEHLEATLVPFMQARKPVLTGVAASAISELTGGVEPRQSAPSRFDEIIKHCAVAKHHAETHGADATEPEWMALLQVLKHCEDGQLWVHGVSDGHPGYNEADTQRKWEARLANSAGPTLCRTFDGYRAALCKKCPHYGFIKTPLQVGVETSEPVDGLPSGWRTAENKRGVERLMIIDQGEGKTTKEWMRVMRYTPSSLRVTRSIVTGRYDLQFEIEIKDSRPWSVHLPGASLGNPRKLSEQLADCGLVFKEKELKSFLDLMSTWLEKLQAARRIADVTESLGWLISDEGVDQRIIGFSCGSTTFYADGRVRNDVRAARDFREVAKLYEPRGALEPWKQGAQFIAEQNNPAFTAILAASFGAPLLRFTGQSGAILSIVSTASGVGKSSALKISQAVWGSKDGINSVDDTPKSVARKLGFLNSLPAYWDELRGRETIEEFVKFAYQLTQGKERSRLDSSAAIRDTSTWETMVVVASNESIFEAMSRNSAGSDAGAVRTFEMIVEPFEYDRNRAEVSLLFERVGSNYGHAGRVYAQYLATHVDEISQKVNRTFVQLAKVAHMDAAERYWFAVMTVLLVGAELATQLGLISFDRRALANFLLVNLQRLRGRTVDVQAANNASEILAAFMQSYQDRALAVDRFPPPRANTHNYIPDITGGTPRSDKIAYVLGRAEKKLRFPLGEFQRWLEHRNLPVYATVKRMEDELGMKMLRCKLGLGTKWELPVQRCYEVSVATIASRMDAIAGAITGGDSSRPDDSPDSPPETVPED